MSPASVAALGRRHGRYCFMVWGAGASGALRAEDWLLSEPRPSADPRERRLYELAFRTGWADAHEGRQRAAKRFDPLEDS